MADRTKKIYDTLKSGGADVGKSYDEFRRWFYKAGDDGYNNRHSVWSALKDGGADVGSYHDFARWTGYRHSPKPTFNDVNPNDPMIIGRSNNATKQSNVGINKWTTALRTPAIDQMQDELEYSLETGKRLKNDIDVGMSTNKYGDVEGSPLLAPKLSRNKDGAIEYGPDGEPLVGYTTDTERRKTYKRGTQQAIDSQKAHDINTNETLDDEVSRLLEDMRSDDMDARDNAMHRLSEIRNLGDDRSNAILARAYINNIADDNSARYRELYGNKRDAIGAGFTATTSYGMPINTTDIALSKDKQLEALRGIDDMLSDAKSHLNEYIKEQDEQSLTWLSRNGGQVARGLASELSDVRNWDLGARDKAVADAKLNAQKAYDSGNATDEQVRLLQVEALLNDIQGKHDLSTAYETVGKTTGAMVPYMVDIALGNKMGVGTKIGGALRKTLMRNLPKLAVTKYGSRLFNATGTLAKDLLDASMTTFVVQNQRVQADAIDRHLGRAVGGIDDNGNMTFAGRDGAKGLGRSVYEAGMSAFVENFSEKVGEYLPFVRNGFTNAGARVAEGMHLGAVTRYIAGASKSDAVKAYKRVMSAVNFNGGFAELAEEMIGGTANALLVGDQSLGDVWSKDNIVQTALGLSLTCGFFSGVGGVVHLTDVARSKTRMSDAEAKAGAMFGDKWQDVKAQIDRDVDNSASDYQTSPITQSIVGKGYTPEQESALTEYANRRMYYRGIVFGVNNVVSDEDTPDYTRRVMSSYYHGQDAVEDKAKREINDELQAQKQNLIDTFGGSSDIVNGIIDTIDEDPVAFVTRYGDRYGGEILDYANARASWQGMMDGVKDVVAEQKTQAEIDVKTRTHEDGQVHPIIFGINKDKGYLVRGRIVLDERGNVDVTQSDETVTVIADGKEQIIKPTSITELLAPVNPNDELQSVQDAITQEAVDVTAEAIAPKYKVGDSVTLSGGVKAEIVAINDDGVQVQTAEPYNGNIINSFLPGELDEMSKGKTDAKDANTANAEEVATDDTSGENEGATGGGTDVEGGSDMPMAGDEPDFYATDPSRGHTYIYDESGLTPQEADEYVQANISDIKAKIDKANKKAPKIGTSISKYNKEKEEHRKTLEELQSQLDYWTKVKAVEDANKAVIARQRADEQARLTAEAQAAEEAYRAEQELKAKEQASIGANNVSQAVKDKWDKSRKENGYPDEIILANGERVKGKYMLVENGSVTPSHNPNAEFAKNEGYPVDSNGNTVNDRDYERDAHAQEITRAMARDYDARALQSVPVVTNDGIVLSGNGRTMAGELAARNGTDTRYIGSLKEYGKKFGFTAEQIDSMSHPRVVFVADEAMPYTTETFAKFNAQEMKSQDKTELAVKLGKVVDDATFGRILQIINKHSTLGDFYADNASTAEAIAELQKSGVINSLQVSEMFDGDSISAIGKDMLENMLIGKAFESNPDAVRQASELKSMRQSIVTALAEISNNLHLGDDYKLERELSEAISLVYQARKNGGYKAGEKVSDYARQMNLFPYEEGETIADYRNAVVMTIADIINDSRVTLLKKYLQIYNNRAKDYASGQLDMFADGLLTKEDILNEVKTLFTNGTEEQKQSALNDAVGTRIAGVDAEATPVDSVGKGGNGGSEPTGAQKGKGSHKKSAFQISIESEEEARAFDKLVPKMSDEELLAHMQKDGRGDASKASHPAVYDEYDYRHRDEQTEAYEHYMQMLGESGTTQEQAEDMLANLRKELSRFATDERAELLGQEEALQDYITELENAVELPGHDLQELIYDLEDLQANGRSYEANANEAYKIGRRFGNGVKNGISKKEAMKIAYRMLEDNYDKGGVYSLQFFDGIADSIDLRLGQNVDEIRVREKSYRDASKLRYDKQGNPIDSNGRLLTDKIASLDEISDDDFIAPTRSIELPKLPKNVDEAIGADGKPVVIKKNIFEKNRKDHKDLSAEDGRAILRSALYTPNLYGQSQKVTRPYNWVVINTKDEQGHNRIVLLEINNGKESVEIVHWHYIRNNALETLKRQAEREGGHILILPSESEEAGGLSSRTNDLPSAGKDTKENADLQEKMSESDKKNLLELTDFAKKTDSGNRTAVDEANFDSEGLTVPLLVDGKPSRLYVMTVVPDVITDEEWQTAVYDYSDEIDDKTNSGWEKWGNLVDAYNEQADEADKAYVRGDTATIGFRSVDAAVKFNDWVSLAEKHHTSETLSNSTDAQQLATEAEYRLAKPLGDTRIEPDFEPKYTVYPKPYTTKRGKVLDMQLLQFPNELTKEQQRAATSLARELRGWWSKEDNGFMMRSVDDAEQIVKTILDEDTVQDAQPLSVADMASVTDASSEDAGEVQDALPMEQETQQTPFKTEQEAKDYLVSIGYDPDGLYMNNPKNEAQDYIDEANYQKEKRSEQPKEAPKNEQAQPKQEDNKANSKWVNEEDAERFEELRKRLRRKLGGQLNMGVDPEAFAIGVELSYLMLKHGARKFSEFAKNLIEALGEEIRPYIKAFYNGARDLPEMAELEKDMTPYDEVRAFDVMNFDKDGATDIIATAKHVVREQSVEREAQEATDKLKQERNEQRKETEQDVAEKNAGNHQEKTSKESKSKKKPVSLQEQTISDLFGEDLKPTSNEQEVHVQPRTSTIKRERGHQREQNEPLGESKQHEDERPDTGGVVRRSGNDTKSDTAGGSRVSEPSDGKRNVNPAKPEPAPPAESERKNTHNNHAERGTDYAPKGTSARIEANIKAIETMQRLIESGEPATLEDMSVLRKFSGWGGLGAAFKEKLEGGWGKPNPVNVRLRELLSPEAYEAANMSRNSAYYTPASVIDAMWDVARAMGFRGGNVLEGSAGIGSIIGLMPTDMSERSNIHAVEIDETTGNILSLLYPDANVEVKGFEKTFVPNGSVDLAITNVPFVTGLRVMDETGDKDLSRKFHDIHDFCIAKNVRKLKEGGVGIFITSSGTLDSPNSAKLRTWLVNEGGADVVGAFRMHNQTFDGTGATSDIIVIRKRVNGRKSANAIDVSGTLPIRTVKYNTGETKRGSSEVIVKDLALDVNKHFVEHPEDMAGEMAFAFEKGDTYRATSKALYPSPSINQEKRLSEWAQQFKDMDWDKAEERESQQVVYKDLGEDVKEGSMLLDSDGNLCLAQRGKAVPINVNANKVNGHTKAECFNAYKAIKDALADVLEYQTTHSDDSGLQQRLAKLNKAYDSFVKTYGHLNKNTSISFLRSDMDYPGIAALESVSETGDNSGKRIVTYGKTDIFSRRVVETESEPKPTTIKDGIIASIYLNGRVDVPYIAEQLNMSDSDVRQQIIESGLGFENPTTTEMEVSYEYLSGNVREKLRQAQENNTDGRYDANIKALERVIPMNIPAHLIEFTLGSSWVEPKLYEDFVKERTGLDVKLTNAGGTWIMSEPYYTNTEQNKAMGVISEKCDKTILGHELIKAAITCKSISVTKTISTGYGSSKTTETIVDKEATMACANKIDEIRQDFKDWARGKMQGDPEMSERMERVYNELFNNSVPKEIPDDFVPEHFGGAATVVNGKPFKLRPHQAKAVIRATTQPLMLAHEVGTGKTYTLISAAMEMRRLGTARKPMIVVQNATVGQFVASAKALYPNAKILTLEDADRNSEGRRNFYAKIRYNDWDMIVVPQSVFERIPDSEERQIRFVEDKVEEKMMVLEKMREAANDDRDPVLRQAQRELDQLNDELNDLKLALQERKSGGNTEKDEKREAKTRQNAMVKAQEMLDRETDDVANFDDMGIDALLIDEAHEYKHLGFATAMQRGVKGVDPSYSKKSQGVYLKTQAVLENKNGKNVVFATGTPISNTAAEIWTFMRYLMPADTMREYCIYYFDDFVRNFGNIQQMLEFSTNGKYKENNRFAGYVNLPELVRIWAGVADTVLTREAGGVSDKIPKIEGGKAQDIYLPQTKALRGVMKFVKDQLDDYEKMSGKEKKKNSHIPLVMYGIAKAAAVDARLVLEDAADEPNSKTNEAVRQTLRSLEDTKEYNGTVAIFADNYQNKATGFNLYEDIRKKLIDAGVSESQIVVMKSGMSVKKKLEIFDKVNRGEVRVIMGSTFTLGTGVNIQERLHTLIHVDAPNRPMDYTQRNGRILRQGNLHKEWGIPVRVLRFGVEDSLDVTAYQRLKTKGAIADSIMEGKKMISNSMENRVLEEEQDLFGDITAQLSGSQYALLKNQVEKEVKKLEARKKQWEADQTYVHNQKRRLKSLINDSEARAESNKKALAKVEAAKNDGITIGKMKFPTLDAMAGYIKEYNSKQREQQEQVRMSSGNKSEAKSDLTINIGGFDFHVHRVITRDHKQEKGQLSLSFFSKTQMTYSCPELELEDVPVDGQRLKSALEDILNNVLSGADFREKAEYADRAAERYKGELQQVEARDGQPFKYADELKQAKEKLAEYEELMKAEMAEKEAKYAEMDASVETAKDVKLSEEDSDDETEDTARYRTVSELAGEIDPTVTLEDYYEYTDATFDAVNTVDHSDDSMHPYDKRMQVKAEWENMKASHPDWEWHRSPKDGSRSEYLIDRENGDVYRYSDHWGVLATCNWKLNGSDVRYETAIGKANISDFRRNNVTAYKYAKAEKMMRAQRAELYPAMRAEAERLGMKFNVRINVIEDVDSITHKIPYIQERRRRSKGWYDTATGQVYIVLPNNRDVEDVRATVFHETVGHKGLRELIGEKGYGDFLREVYEHADKDVRRRIDSLAEKRRWNLDKATDEYLSVLAEKDFKDFDQTERSAWQWLKDKVLKAIDRFLGSLMLPGWVKLSDNELRYILWRSKERLERGKESPMDTARDVVKRRELGIDSGLYSMGYSEEELDIISRAKADGSYMQAPNGKPTNLSEKQWAQVRTEAFKKWFGDWEKNPDEASKVVDENGEPKVVLHGTPNAGFYEFKEDKIGSSNDAGWLGRGFYFYGNNPEYASQYGKGGRVMEVYLNIRNPYYATSEDMERLADANSEEASREFREILESEDYDGVYYNGDLNEEWVAFYPNQIKSATENIGTFDKTNDDVRYREGGLHGEKDADDTLLEREREEYEDGDEIGVYESGGRWRAEGFAFSRPTKEQLLDAVRSLYGDYAVSLSEDGRSFVMERIRYGGRRSYTKKQIDARKDRWMRQMRHAVESLLDQMGIGDLVTVVEDSDGLIGRRANAKGWYDVKTGKIVIVLGNHANSSDVVMTIMHEVVGHYGLRRMFGEHFDAFLDNVYKSVTPEIRRDIDRLAERYGARLEGENAGSVRSDESLRRLATEEYLAKLAEDTDYNRRGFHELMITVRALFLKMLHKIGLRGFDYDGLGENELRYLLWRSYENIVHPNEYRSILGEARDIVMRRRLKIDSAVAPASRVLVAEAKRKHPEATFMERSGNGYAVRGEDAVKVAKVLGVSVGIEYGESVVNIDATEFDDVLPKLLKSGMRVAVVDAVGKVGESTLFRDGADLREEYDSEMRKSSFQVREAYQDSMLSLRRLMEIINRSVGRNKTMDYENPYMAENALSSKNNAEAREFTRQYYKPLVKVLRALEKLGIRINDVNKYLMSKHAIERNREMSVRSAMTDKSTRKIDQAQLDRWNERKNDVRKSIGTWSQKQRELDRIAIDEFGVDIYSRDYSGVKELHESDSVEDAINESYSFVEMSERAHPAEFAHLNNLINGMSASILSKMLDSGLINADTLASISDMYDNYIPLRGFREDTSDDIYAYVDSESHAFNAPVKAAKGRKSVADDPIANLVSMMDSAILQGNRNMVKQQFLNFVLNRPTPLVSVSEQWIALNPITGEWETVSPTIPDDATPEEVESIVRQFNEDMQNKLESERINGLPNTVKTVSERANVPYRVLNDRKNQHQVVVKRNGKMIVLTINGNPRAAMALNGVTNPDSDFTGVGGGFLKAIQKVNRTLSLNFTGRNPEFTVRNYMRDSLYTQSMVWVKESARYALHFHRNMIKYNPAMMLKLFVSYENGTLDKNDKTELGFYIFMRNGGETGYSNLREIEDIKRDIGKDVENGLLHKTAEYIERIEVLNRAVENSARFSAFMASMADGRSVQRSIWDAKEISVNFNKKGSGGTYFNKNGQTLIGSYLGSVPAAAFRTFHIFFNAGVQGLFNMSRSAFGSKSSVIPSEGKARIAKFVMLCGAYYLLGFMSRIINGGDDDDSAYDTLSEFARRNNIVLPAYGGMFVTVNLPIEFRPMYGLGELAYSVMSGKEQYSDSELAMKVGEQMAQALPINILEGGGGLYSLIPSVVTPLVDVGRNLSWNGAPIYKDSEYNKYDPEWKKAYSKTNGYIVSTAKAVSDVTGGDDVKPGKVDLNPAVVQYIAEGYLGGLMTFANKTATTIDAALSAEAPEVRNVPILSTVLAEGTDAVKERAINGKYFKNVEALNKLRSMESDYKKIVKDPDSSIESSARNRLALKILQSKEESRNLHAFEEVMKLINERTELNKNEKDEELEQEIIILKNFANKVASGDKNFNGSVNIGGKSYSPKPANARVQRDLTYFEHSTNNDYKEDALIDRAIKRTKIDGDNRQEEALIAEKRILSEIKKRFDTEGAVSVMRDYRKRRKEIIDRYNLR